MHQMAIVLICSPLRDNSSGTIHRQTLALCLHLPGTPTLTIGSKSYGNELQMDLPSVDCEPHFDESDIYFGQACCATDRVEVA
jgi:hypothetical protein